MSPGFVAIIFMSRHLRPGITELLSTSIDISTSYDLHDMILQTKYYQRVEGRRKISLITRERGDDGSLAHFIFKDNIIRGFFEPLLHIFHLRNPFR